MPSARTMFDAYWAARRSGLPAPRGEGMRIKRIMIALVKMAARNA